MGAKPSFPLVPLEERIAIVTGGNTGIGYEVAKWLAVMGANVIIACRSEERATNAIERMQSDYEELKTNKKIGDLKELNNLKVEFMSLDLSSLTSTEKFADNFKKSRRQLHLLICNAGIMATPYEITDDGYELMLQVNYLSHFLLTAKLLPVMLTSGEDCRIHNVSSSGHHWCLFDLETMNYSGDPEQFPRFSYYGRSKLYQIMQTRCMARRLRHDKNVTVNASHPGVVNTELIRGVSDMRALMLLTRVVLSFISLKTPMEGATTAINCAVNPELKEANGIYFVDCKDTPTTDEAINIENQEALWKKTIELLKDRMTEEEVRCLEGEVKQ